ncbi:IS481 family transposase [Mycobacterium intracellulare]|jgi:transposase InsO family protein|uniref:Integrase catalytic domain-containing protein n=2 Tax=Mycobacterium intracellulare TaxID=1767 RepID=A0A7R7MRF8_MYCIT|nr:IS481 family transposase [Mycobacterium intracellulare]ETZ35740.1 integrase core domain protein [Mycobacterium intracellulare MIN_061107_1834]ETZ35747.1 integrase core domain protein [Mycobacterium intracellulare MIN_061107_1834]MEE3803707.1 IS481 family transposase [Mycobacterium intracellulare]MEE3804714.1 IS481 family transposase [Mycobacterium intracellulare]OBG12709.1 transposase [Mycobacterium intracellulare]
MSKAQLVITAVVLEGRSKSAVARDYEVSRYWVHQLVKRYEAEGPAAFEPRSRRPHTNPRAVAGDLEERIVRLRKTLLREGYDAGAATIAEHLARDPAVATVPALATIWRVLSRRGFITAQPQKRPRSSWKRFEADLPNQCWQADVTHWQLADHTSAEILNIIDDHSRLAIASTAYRTVTAPDVVEAFTAAFATWGTPAALLTDNGAVFTATPRRGGRTALQILLGELGITYINSRPYHPQTCGKVERFHQTLKKRLTAVPPATTITELQSHLNEFVNYYNTVRPHRAVGRRTPHHAFTSRPAAFPTGYHIPPHFRLRHDRIDAAGVITVRYNSRLHHIGLSKHLRGTHVIVLINNRDIRVLARDTGQLIRKLTLDPTRDYQPRGVKPGNSPTNKPQM